MKDKVIFDVGAYNGIDGLALAIKNPKFKIYAFEPNPFLIEEITSNKLKFEKRIGKKILNYKLIEKAVSSENTFGNFFISKNPTGSSLKRFSDNLDETWPGYREAHFHVVKTIKVEIITLEKFLLDNKIEFINYLHIDTQGNDLNVLKGLGRFKNKVGKGILEAAVDKDKSLYKNNHTIEDVKNFFKTTGYSIEQIKPIDSNIKNEVNIKFKNKNYINLLNISTNYNVRYYARVVNGNTYFKDDIKDFLLKIINFFIK